MYVDKVKINPASLKLPLVIAKRYVRSVCDIFGIKYKDINVKIYDKAKEKMVYSNIKITN